MMGQRLMATLMPLPWQTQVGRRAALPGGLRCHRVLCTRSQSYCTSLLPLMLMLMLMLLLLLSVVLRSPLQPGVFSWHDFFPLQHCCHRRRRPCVLRDGGGSSGSQRRAAAAMTTPAPSQPHTQDPRRSEPNLHEQPRHHHQRGQAGNQS